MFECSNLVAIDLYLLFYLFNSDTVHYLKMTYLKVKTDFYLIFKVCSALSVQVPQLNLSLLWIELFNIIFNIHVCFTG